MHKSKYQIWDNGVLCNAYKSKPKNKNARRLVARTIQEAKIGIKYYIPAEASNL